LIIVTHIPKTGTSSFLHYLRGIYGFRLFHDHREPRQAPLFWVLKLVRRAGSPGLNRLVRRVFIDDVRVPPRMACIAGHFLATKYDRAFPRARHAVWLRDPVERVASNYHYWRRLADQRNAYCQLIRDKGLTLSEFAALPRMRNRQSYYLDGKPVSAFDFVGVTEHYAAAGSTGATRSCIARAGSASSNPARPVGFSHRSWSLYVLYALNSGPRPAQWQAR
jgi:hypothetical protein